MDVGCTHLYPQYWGGRDDQTTGQLVYLLGNFQASERPSWKIKVNRATDLHMQCTHTRTWVGREREREDEPKVFQISMAYTEDSMASCLYPDITSSLMHMVNPPSDKIVSLYQPRGSKGHGLLHCALGGLSCQRHAMSTPPSHVARKLKLGWLQKPCQGPSWTGCNIDAGLSLSLHLCLASTKQSMRKNKLLK